MGKATIVSGGADGLYTIKIDAGAQQQASRVEAINQELTTVAERIAQAETEYLATTAAETNAMAILNVAIESYASAVQADPETASTADVDRLTGAYYEAAAYAGQARVRLQALMLQQRQLESDKSNLVAAPAEETREAWCVDLTEDASGDVATIEVPGEPGTVLVAPGGAAPTGGDGALLARELMTPEQAFFNAAILPGWQKWMPTFRTGTITAIHADNDTADVSLDAATSSAQGLGINQASSLSGVPIEYMECNAAAFEVGDPCVVRFDGQSWDAPRVVGFAREPKTCMIRGWCYGSGVFNPAAKSEKMRWRDSGAIGFENTWVGSNGAVVSYGRYGIQFQQRTFPPRLGWGVIGACAHKENGVWTIYAIMMWTGGSSQVAQFMMAKRKISDASWSTVWFNQNFSFTSSRAATVSQQYKMCVAQFHPSDKQAVFVYLGYNYPYFVTFDTSGVTTERLSYEYQGSTSDTTLITIEGPFTIYNGDGIGYDGFSLLTSTSTFVDGENLIAARFDASGNLCTVKMRHTLNHSFTETPTGHIYWGETQSASSDSVITSLVFSNGAYIEIQNYTESSSSGSGIYSGFVSSILHLDPCNSSHTILKRTSSEYAIAPYGGTPDSYNEIHAIYIGSNTLEEYTGPQKLGPVSGRGERGGAWFLEVRTYDLNYTPEYPPGTSSESTSSTATRTTKPPIGAWDDVKVASFMDKVFMMHTRGKMFASDFSEADLLAASGDAVIDFGKTIGHQQ